MSKPAHGQHLVSFKPRLEMPVEAREFNIDEARWRMLTNSLYPSARSPTIILMAVQYCLARNLDIVTKPVHIVSVWNKSLNCWAEDIWPSISGLLITAHRTEAFAGKDREVSGEVVTRVFEGELKRRAKKGQRETRELREITVTYPSTVEATVYRIVKGVRCPFTYEMTWRETYARIGKTSLPNAIWERRPFDQAKKCALAGALRVAFPEEMQGMYAAEEMAGQSVENGGVPYDGEPVFDALPETAAEKAIVRRLPTEELPISVPVSYAEADISQRVKQRVSECIERAKATNNWTGTLEWIRSRLENPADRAYAEAIFAEAGGCSASNLAGAA